MFKQDLQIFESEIKKNKKNLIFVKLYNYKLYNLYSQHLEVGDGCSETQLQMAEKVN